MVDVNEEAHTNEFFYFSEFSEEREKEKICACALLARKNSHPGFGLGREAE